MNAWLFQDSKQLAKLGDKCPWSVGWYDPDGKRKGKKIGAKSRAQKYARKIEGQLAAGTYENADRKKWGDFVADYKAKGLPGAAAGTLDVVTRCLKHFERLAKPASVSKVTSRTISDFVATRTSEGVSPATVNKELRHLRASLRKAYKWGYLPRVPEIEFLREPGKLATYVSPEHFAALYQHADAAKVPNDLPCTAAEWWRALLVTAYMTGWRIGSLLALRRQDVDLDKGVAISRAADNKGKRDQRVPLHPLIVEHLRPLVGFSPLVFAWSDTRRAVYDVLEAIQTKAGVKPDGKARYGFHDFRRAFATMNADTLTPDALQSLMQHKAYTTTQKYINMARQMNPAVQSLYVPALPTIAATG